MVCYRQYQERHGDTLVCDLTAGLFHPNTGTVLAGCAVVEALGAGGVIARRVIDPQYNTFVPKLRFLTGNASSSSFGVDQVPPESRPLAHLAAQRMRREPPWEDSGSLGHLAHMELPSWPVLPPRRGGQPAPNASTSLSPHFLPPTTPRQLWTNQVTTLLITRDCNPPYNPFHCLSAFLDTLQTMAMMQLEPQRVRCLFLDSAPVGPYEILWKALCAEYITRQEWSQWAGQQVYMPYAVFSPTSSFLWTDFWKPTPCPFPSPIVVALKRLFLTALDRWAPGSLGKFPLPCNKKKRVTFMVRSHSRKLRNQREVLVEMERAFPAADVVAIDPGTIPFEDQVGLVHATDVLVGVHGAALTNLLYLRPSAHVIEVHPHFQRAQCYRNLALWSGVRYSEVGTTKVDEATPPGKQDVEMDSVVDVDALLAVVAQALHVDFEAC